MVYILIYIQKAYFFEEQRLDGMDCVELLIF